MVVSVPQESQQIRLSKHFWDRLTRCSPAPWPVRPRAPETSECICIRIYYIYVFGFVCTSVRIGYAWVNAKVWWFCIRNCHWLGLSDDGKRYIHAADHSIDPRREGQTSYGFGWHNKLSPARRRVFKNLEFTFFNVIKVSVWFIFTSISCQAPTNRTRDDTRVHVYAWIPKHANTIRHAELRVHDFRPVDCRNMNAKVIARETCGFRIVCYTRDLSGFQHCQYSNFVSIEDVSICFTNSCIGQLCLSWY